MSETEADSVGKQRQHEISDETRVDQIALFLRGPTHGGNHFFEHGVELAACFEAFALHGRMAARPAPPVFSVPVRQSLRSAGSTLRAFVVFAWGFFMNCASSRQMSRQDTSARSEASRTAVA